MARDIAEHGRPDGESEEAGQFTELLVRAFAVERDVLPIESLFYADDPAPVTPPLSQPQFAAPAPLGPLELVSHGEHLCQSADLVAASRSPIERDLRLYHLLGTLRTAGTPGPDPVGSALVVFARSAREALAAGVAAHATPALVSCLREAGELLRAVADADDRMLISRRILDSAYRLDGLRLAEPQPHAPIPPSPAASPAADTSRIVPIESLLYDEQPVEAPAELPIVSIESLAFDAPAGGLEGSYATFDRLRRERPAAPASLEALVGQALAATTPAAADPEVVTIEIGSLVYRGRAALERANAVRQQLADELARNGGIEKIQPLLQELLDLVPLALADA
jgi:hypothetical protein